jgi:peptidoglycan/xylan/chitin deacetylase (PgdA/CDA1 family)
MLTAATAGLLRVAEPAERRLLLLIYHRVLPDRDELFPREITAEVFDWQMRSLAKHLAPLPLTEAIERLEAGTLPRRAVAVTFDDGYADNLAVAAPILRGAGVPATFFVATGYLGGGRMWNDTVIEAVRRLPDGEHDFGPLGLPARTVRGVEGRRAFCRDFITSIKHHPHAERQARADQLAAYVGRALPDHLMMAPAQVAELAGLGFEIGGHTVSHPILRVLDGPEAAREIAEGRSELERIVGRPVRLFAYPNGRPGEDYGDRDVELVRQAGFEAAVSTRRGACSRRSDRWQLPRFSSWERTPARWLARVLLAYRSPA